MLLYAGGPQEQAPFVFISKTPRRRYCSFTPRSRKLGQKDSWKPVAQNRLEKMRFLHLGMDSTSSLRSIYTISCLSVQQKSIDRCGRLYSSDKIINMHLSQCPSPVSIDQVGGKKSEIRSHSLFVQFQHHEQERRLWSPVFKIARGCCKKIPLTLLTNDCGFKFVLSMRS
jgi:hypothetical protein